MRSLVFEGPGRLEVRESMSPALGPRDVRVTVEACGVCGSDLTSYLSGAYVSAGQVMGHEFVGRVSEAGRDRLAPTGARVVVRPMRSCGECWYCRRGEIHLCAATARLSLSFGLPGGYADEVLVPDAVLGETLFVVPDSVDPLDALWAEPLAVALHAVRRGGIAASSRVLVMGAGSVGLCLAVAALSLGAQVVVAEPRAARRDLVANLGAQARESIDPRADGPFDLLLDSTGIGAVVAGAAGAVHPDGRVVLVGVQKGGLPLLPVTTYGSFGYDLADFRESVHLVTSGSARLGLAVTHEFDLTSADLAMDALQHDPTAGKVVIRP